MKLFFHYIKYLLRIHIAALMIFAAMRLLLLLTIDYTFPADITTADILTAFLKGVWFDNVICCYIMVLPVAVFGIASVFNYYHRCMKTFAQIWFGIFFALSFAIAAANIPYFCYFFQPINSSIFQWFGYAGTTAGMVVGEASYWPPILYGIIAIAGFITFLIKIKPLNEKQTRISPTPSQRAGAGLCTLILIGLCFFGIRGRIGYNPIKVSEAYFCNDPFLNQLGISPVFNLLDSALDASLPENQRLSLMNDDEAVKAVQQLLGRKGIKAISPIARHVEGNDTLGTFKGRNVVIILMESMSASLVNSLNGTKGLTPFLDTLYHQSWAFTNMYSAGNHTNHGMYATLYSWPAIMFRNLMKGTVIPHYSGLPTVLHDNGYHNMFFMTHESQYDNMNAFFRTNGFDDIYAQENYPADKVANSFGVQDDFLYSYAVPVLTKYWNSTHQTATSHGKLSTQGGGCFFTVLLSISNHPPYVIPSWFHGKGKTDEERIVEYADYSIRMFFEKARKQPWYDNTIFVLLGDHGKLMPSPESELPESYNHIPLIIYGKGITPHIQQDFAIQEDVAPTLLSMLGISYTQNNFGIDLRREHRDCVFYTGDKFVAARDHQRLYLYNPTEKKEMLYYVKGKNSVVKAPVTDARFQYLRHYVFSMLQCAEKLVGEKRTTTNK